MLCANCDNKGVFTTMTAIGEKAFCCEKCFAEYVGLPVEKEGYYGFMAETELADEEWEEGVYVDYAPSELIRKRLKEAGLKPNRVENEAEFYFIKQNGIDFEMCFSWDEYDGYSRLTVYESGTEYGDYSIRNLNSFDPTFLYDKGILKEGDFLEHPQGNYLEVYWEGTIKDWKNSHNCADYADLEIYGDNFIVMECNICGKTATFRQETSFYAESFEASVVHKGKQPKGAVGKAMMNHAMLERANLESVIQELENKVKLGIISEEGMMKSLTQRFGAEFEVIDWNELHDTNRELFVQRIQEYYDDFKESNPELHKQFEKNVMNEESWYGYERGKSYAETKEKWTKKLSDLGYEYERIDDYWEYIGHDITPKYVPCSNCDGEGIIITKYYPATRDDPADSEWVYCEMCDGEGKVLEEKNAESVDDDFYNELGVDWDKVKNRKGIKKYMLCMPFPDNENVRKELYSSFDDGRDYGMYFGSRGAKTYTDEGILQWRVEIFEDNNEQKPIPLNINYITEIENTIKYYFKNDMANGDADFPEYEFTARRIGKNYPYIFITLNPIPADEEKAWKSLWNDYGKRDKSCSHENLSIKTMEVLDGEVLLTFDCDNCGKRTSTSASLNQGWNAENVEGDWCPECNRDWKRMIREGHGPDCYFEAETKLKKDSCCCGATKSKPCLCMIQGNMKCAAKSPMCPCYKEIAMGTKVEMEHTKSKEKAEKIAKEHLAEHPDYYSRLKSAGLSAETFEAKGKKMSILEIFSDNNAVLNAFQDGIEVFEQGYGHREAESFVMEFSPDMKSCELVLLRNLGKHGNAIEKEGFFLCGVVDFKNKNIWSWVQQGLYENPMWEEMQKLTVFSESDSPLFKTMLKTYEKKLEEIGFENPRMDYYQEEGAFEMKFDSYTPVYCTSHDWSNSYLRDLTEDGVTFQQECWICGVTRRGYSKIKLYWEMDAETFNAESEERVISIDFAQQAVNNAKQQGRRMAYNSLADMRRVIFKIAKEQGFEFDESLKDDYFLLSFMEKWDR